MKEKRKGKTTLKDATVIMMIMMRIIQFYQEAQKKCIYEY